MKASSRSLSENRKPTAEIPFRPDLPIKIVKYTQYSPPFIEKSDSKWAPLDTAPILRQAPSQLGFTLIEVLIASAIVMPAMGIILQLFRSGLERLHKVGEQAHLIIAQKEIQHRLSTLNPAVKKQGSGVVEGWEYSWAARQKEDYRHVSESLGEIPFPRYVALYSIDVTLRREEQRDISWQMLRLGWRHTP